jgi:opacity protein-like surface antigen
MRRLAIASAVFVLFALAPRPAHAQGYFVPFFGYDFGGDAGACPPNTILINCSVRRAAYGLNFGSLAAGIVGFDADISYAPDFFGKSDSFGANSVLTFMSNVVIAVPAGPVHPYVTGGLGFMRTKVELKASSLLSTSNTSFGYNIGGGIMVFLPSHLGVRIDYRNIRSASDITIAGINIQNRKLSFSRLAFGLVLH